MKRLFLIFLSFCCYALVQAQPPLAYDFPEKPQSACYEQDAAKCYRLVENQARYLLSIVRPWHGDNRYKLLTATKGGEEHITRPNTGAIAIFCFLHRFGDYSEREVGVSRQVLLNDYIIPMMRYVLSVHKTGDKTFDGGKQWGRSWQSAHWTHQLGQGAMSVWNVLPEEIRAGVLRVVRAEADEIASKNPPYNLTVDSKSEENAWNAGALSAALMLMPGDARVPVWQEALQRWLLSAYLCPNDADKEILIDGRPLKDQFEGANIYNDYTLENHGLVHPDYMTACTLKGEVMIDFLATGRPMPDACMYNIDHIYEQLKILLLPSGGFVYPTGQDWAIFRHCDWTNMHAFCLYYYNDPEALHWLRVTLDVIDRMQRRHADGRIYAPHENDFPSSQTLCGLGLADTWKMLMLAKPVTEAQPRPTVAKIYPDGKFFIRKTGTAVHTVAWGKKIQFQALSQSKDPLVAPDWQNGVGFIRLKGEKRSLPLKLKGVEIDTLAVGYTFRLHVEHGDAVRADYTVTSLENGDLQISEKLVAMRDVTTEAIETQTIGILNHQGWIEEKGYRMLSNEGTEVCMESMSGVRRAVQGKEVSVDHRLTVRSEKPLQGSYTCTDQWKASKQLDRLVLNEQNGEHSWRRGEVIHENTVTLSYTAAD